jgi:hypothetical protein
MLRSEIPSIKRPAPDRGSHAKSNLADPHGETLTQNRSRFRLEKYYLDAVDERGRWLICYSARLDLGPFSLSYADCRHASSLKAAHTGPMLGDVRDPLVSVESLTWHQPGLGIEGRWTRRTPPRTVRLFEEGSGAVDWCCLQPSADATIGTQSGAELQGLGYCERLLLTLPPWRLGLKRLRWGRFVSQTHSLVWISWQGANPLSLVLWNGTRLSGTTHISDDRIFAEDVTLSISPVEIIHDRFPLREVFSRLPRLQTLAPQSLRQLHEVKRLARGRFDTPGNGSCEGWIIDETVDWPG